MKKVTRDNLLEVVGTVGGAAAAGINAGEIAKIVFLSNFVNAPWIRIPAAFAFKMIGAGVGAVIGNKAGRLADIIGKEGEM